MPDESIKLPATFDNSLAPSLNHIGFRTRIKFDGQCLKHGHVDNRKKNIDTQRLGNTTLTAKKVYAINLSEQRKKSCLSLHYNGANNYLFLNCVEIFKFKAKDSKINAVLLCLGNASKDFSTDDMKKTGFYGYVSDFPGEYNSIDVDDVLDIHKYLMKKHDIKQCLGLLKKCLLNYCALAQ